MKKGTKSFLWHHIFRDVSVCSVFYVGEKYNQRSMAKREWKETNKGATPAFSNWKTNRKKKDYGFWVFS